MTKSHVIKGPVPKKKQEVKEEKPVEKKPTEDVKFEIAP